MQYKNVKNNTNIEHNWREANVAVRDDTNIFLESLDAD